MTAKEVTLRKSLVISEKSLDEDYRSVRLFERGESRVRYSDPYYVHLDDSWKFIDEATPLPKVYRCKDGIHRIEGEDYREVKVIKGRSILSKIEKELERESRAKYLGSSLFQ